MDRIVFRDNKGPILGGGGVVTPPPAPVEPVTPTPPASTPRPEPIQPVATEPVAIPVPQVSTSAPEPVVSVQPIPPAPTPAPVVSPAPIPEPVIEVAPVATPAFQESFQAMPEIVLPGVKPAPAMVEETKVATPPVVEEPTIVPPQSLPKTTAGISLTGKRESNKEAEALYQQGIATLRDLIAPPAIKVSSNTMQIGEVLSRTYFVVAYPRYLSTNWFSPIINIDFSMDIALFIHPIDTAEIMKNLRKSATQVQSQIHIENEEGKIRDPMLETALQDIEGVTKAT